MILTLTLETLCSRNVFVFKKNKHLMMLIAIKYNDEFTTNCEQITLNMRK